MDSETVNAARGFNAATVPFAAEALPPRRGREGPLVVDIVRLRASSDSIFLRIACAHQAGAIFQRRKLDFTKRASGQQHSASSRAYLVTLALFTPCIIQERVGLRLRSGRASGDGRMMALAKSNRGLAPRVGEMDSWGSAALLLGTRRERNLGGHRVSEG